MRKVYLFNLVSLDGFFEAPNSDISWHSVDEEFDEFAIQQLTDTDAIIFGRITYELMASFWPTPDAIAMDPIVAGLMNKLPKVVFSRTLKRVTWQNSRLGDQDIAAEIKRLKEQPGKDIAIFGSADLAVTLIRLGLIDEYRLLVNPLLLGKGTPMFKDPDTHLSLRLESTRVFGNGNVLLTYQPKPNGHQPV